MDRRDTHYVLFSPELLLRFRSALTPRLMPLLHWYEEYYAYSAGDPGAVLPEDLRKEMLAMSRVLMTRLPDEESRAKVEDLLTAMRPAINRMLYPDRASATTFRMFAEEYGHFLVELGRMFGIYMRGTPVPPVYFLRFRKMAPAEESTEILRAENPALFEQIQKNKQTVVEIDEAITKRIQDSGQALREVRVSGRRVFVGVDPASGEETVYDLDGSVLPLEAYKQRRREEEEAIKRMTKLDKRVSLEDLTTLTPQRREEIKNIRYSELDRVFVEDINRLPRLGDAELEAVVTGPVRHTAMTDDKVKATNALTRIYAVQDTRDGRSVVVDGRYKGMYLDELVNAAGRMIEGTAYVYQDGKRMPIDFKDEEGNVRMRSTQEPYVTVDENGKLFMSIPGTGAFTEARQAMSKIKLESLEALPKVQGSRARYYKFDAKDFESVQTAVGGLSLSSAAIEKVSNHFDRLIKQERALRKPVSDMYTAERIGGFKPGVQLRETQREGLAWCEARGWSGVLALDTGLGKSMVSIAAMQKMIRDGLSTEGNQRFLFVCPAKLKGNVPKEIYTFLEDPKALLDVLDVMSYDEYRRAAKKDPGFANDYVAIFFDEVQDVKSPTNSTNKAIAATKNNRKVLLSASPMETDPVELLMVFALANNVVIYDERGRMTPEFKRQKDAWIARYSESVGGRTIGIKNDPDLKREFAQWVKSNLYYRSKTDAPEINLKPLEKNESVAVTMDPEVEARYKELAKQAKEAMAGMVLRYRDDVRKGISPKADKYRGGALGRVFRELQMLSDFPGKTIPGAKSPKIEESASIIGKRLEVGSRSLLFTDSPDMALETAKELSDRYPGRGHAVALNTSIQVWKNGKMVTQYRATGKYFRDEKRQRNPVPKDEWAVHVLSNIIQADQNVLTLTLTSGYNKGQNLQGFSTVINLDRDSWNSEVMNQRIARSWRAGQKDDVQVYTMDAVYEEPTGDLDRTLDEIRSYMQAMEASLFDEVVVQTKKQSLGEAFEAIERLRASDVALNRKYMAQALSPYAKTLAEVDPR